MLVIAAWCAFLFLYGVSAGPLYRTEALRAIIGRSCFDGHWLYPVLYGEPFLTKPPGHYAAIGLCSLAFGEVSAATARLPSVFAATLAVVLMHGMFRRVLGERAALLVALLLPCSVLWLDKVPSAEIDMTLVGWVTAAVVLFHRALETEGRESFGWWVAALLCVAGGTLTKWTAPAFFYLTVIPLLAWRRQLALLVGWRHLLAVSVAVAACALWAVAVIQQVGWDALADTIRKEAAYRFSPKVSKGYPWSEVATYPLAVFAAHLPVSAFALLTLRASFWARFDERGKLLLQLLHCWTWPNLLFWTLVPNHNVRYALPLSAGLMGLGVMGLWALLKRPTPPAPLPSGRGEPDLLPSPFREGWGGRLPFVCAFLLCWFVAKVVFVQVVVPQRTAGRNAEATGAALREHVPPGQPLYLFKLKDEGVTFYYACPAARAATHGRYHRARSRYSSARSGKIALRSDTSNCYAVCTISRATRFTLSATRRTGFQPVQTTTGWKPVPQKAMSAVPKAAVQTLTVSQLTAQVKGTLETKFLSVWVAGEVSNFTRASSGHWYFTLKDDGAQIKTVAFRGINLRLRFDPKNGMEIVARGRLTVYDPRGEYQFIVEEMQPKGVGAAELALRQLKEKLLAKGYFSPDRKRPLPRPPRRVGLVASATGAAIRDMIEVFAQRWPFTELIVRPSRVQGEGAAHDISLAVRQLNWLHRNNKLSFDAIILGRGGGSAEDLWAFNEEAVADAIFNSNVPVISAVGHETDVTVADLVADYRAETPTAAVVTLTPDRRELLAALRDLRERMADAAARRVTFAKQRLDQFATRPAFRRPLQRVNDLGQRLDDTAERLARAAKVRLTEAAQKLAALSARLETLSPLQVLARGYSLTHTDDGRLVRDAAGLRPGDVLVTQVAAGTIRSLVTAAAVAVSTKPEARNPKEEQTTD